MEDLIAEADPDSRSAPPAPDTQQPRSARPAVDTVRVAAGFAVEQWGRRPARSGPARTQVSRTSKFRLDRQRIDTGRSVKPVGASSTWSGSSTSAPGDALTSRDLDACQRAVSAISARSWPSMVAAVPTSMPSQAPAVSTSLNTMTVIPEPSTSRSKWRALSHAPFGITATL